MNYENILRQTIDLHVHVGPEIIPRKFDIKELANFEKGKLRGVAVKNHFFPAILPYSEQSKDFLVVSSIVLNVFQGGWNPDIIRAAKISAGGPIVVWFPTISASSFVRDANSFIPQEWLGDREIKCKTLFSNSLNIRGKKKNTIDEKVILVLKAIKECGAVLATGHLSWRESLRLIAAAQKIGIKKIIITHPIYQRIAMPIFIQKKLAEQGAFIESCYSMYSIDKIPIKLIAKQIKTIGARRCILSSDVGQKFSLSPSEALRDFMYLLSKNGITEDELYQMLVINPSYLVETGQPVAG
jgi:hypothetical protein